MSISSRRYVIHKVDELADVWLVYDKWNMCLVGTPTETAAEARALRDALEEEELCPDSHTVNRF